MLCVEVGHNDAIRALSMHRSRIKLARLSIATLAVLALLAAIFLRPVRDDDMAPTLTRGDFVLLMWLEPEVGDVVSLRDPLDPRRWTLRRVLAGEGVEVSFKGNTPILDGIAPRQVEMYRDSKGAILKEADSYLLSTGPTANYYDIPPETVPPGKLWLAADHRDVPLDSRFWGPVGRERLERVAVLRLGLPDGWRKIAELP